MLRLRVYADKHHQSFAPSNIIHHVEMRSIGASRKDEDFFPGYVNGRKFLKEGIVPSTFRFSAQKVLRRKLQRHNAQPVSNRSPVDMTAALADDENDITTASESQPPPDPEVSVLVATLQGQVAKQAAHMSKLTSDLQEVQKELTEAKNEVLKLTRHIELLEESNKKMEEKLSRKFSIECFKDSPKDVQFYTGLPNYDAYLDLLRRERKTPSDCVPLRKAEGGVTRTARQARRQPGLTVEESCIKVSKLLGVGVRTILEIRKQAKETEGQDVTPSRKRPGSEGKKRRKVRHVIDIEATFRRGGATSAHIQSIVIQLDGEDTPSESDLSGVEPLDEA
ncbi:hypothetical protein HPB47_019639 [Ixodes persulcatus]|uniref:Uncharacterized protein n=1 Tax=Ixodes persulcatus TaxID=34615 RepID=A0AC60QK70_IXOPE|nr:hypothetical protein HPB47_019639 [Ixodes persulcatus]